jgi:hypothetical protein
MALPADPRNLVAGIYNKMGQNLVVKQEPEDVEQAFYKHALSDPDDYKSNRETPFDMLDYNFN